MVPFFESENIEANCEPGIQLPTITAARTARTPISVASPILPLRIRYIQRPMKSPMGMVQAIVKVPQELPGTNSRAPFGKVTVSVPSSEPLDALGTSIKKASERAVTAPPAV